MPHTILNHDRRFDANKIRASTISTSYARRNTFYPPLLCIAIFVCQFPPRMLPYIMGYRISLPCKQDFLSIWTYPDATDFAIATGLQCSSSNALLNQSIPEAIWTGELGAIRHGAKPIAYRPGNTTPQLRYDAIDDHSATLSPDEITCGVVPMFLETSNPDRVTIKSPIGMAVYENDDVLTIDGRVAFYPKSLIPNDAKNEPLLTQLEKYRKISANIVASINTVQRIQGTGLFKKSSDIIVPHETYLLGNNLYTYVVHPKSYHQSQYNKFSNGKICLGHPDQISGMWFACEPISVAVDTNRQFPNEKIICTDALLNMPFEDPKTLNKMCKLYKPGDDISEEANIYKLLNSVFLNNIRLTAAQMNIRPNKTIDTQDDAPAQTKLVKFKIGDTVKIKCEGRTGVVKKIDQNTETATLNVNGKTLTYRTDDLILEGQ